MRTTESPLYQSKRTNTLTTSKDNVVLVKNPRMDLDYNSNYAVSKSSLYEKQPEVRLSRVDQANLPIPHYQP